MDNEALRPLRALREIESFHSPMLGCVNTESPLAEKIRGMIGWCKQALDLDPRVYGMGKRLEFSLVHVLTMEFRQSVFYPCHLGRTFRHGNKGLIISVLSHVITLRSWSTGGIERL